MVGAMVVENIVCEVDFPSMGIVKLVCWSTFFAVGQEMCNNFTGFVFMEDARVASDRCVDNPIIIIASKLGNIFERAKA